jgi:hypothetical protein
MFIDGAFIAALSDGTLSGESGEDCIAEAALVGEPLYCASSAAIARSC